MSAFWSVSLVFYIYVYIGPEYKLYMVVDSIPMVEPVPMVVPLPMLNPLPMVDPMLIEDPTPMVIPVYSWWTSYLC